jgi:hypothetical protein
MRVGCIGRPTGWELSVLIVVMPKRNVRMGDVEVGFGFAGCEGSCCASA